MSAYVVARIDVIDWARYKEYMKATPGVIAQFGGRFIARGGEVVTLEGPDEVQRIVLMAFPSMDQVRAYYDSREYAEARALREGAAIVSAIAIEGL